MKLQKVLLLTAIALISKFAVAQTFEVDGIAYNVTSDVEPYTVEVTSKEPKYTGDIIIPSQVLFEDVTYQVTSIGDEAFSFCSSLYNVTMPNSILSIGDFAFKYCNQIQNLTIVESTNSIGEAFTWGCANLLNISVDENNLNFLSLDGVLFNIDTTILLTCPGGRAGMYAVPDGVIGIGSYAFFLCKNLTSIILPQSLTHIGESAFKMCLLLESITIPENVSHIGFKALSRNPNLQSINVAIGNVNYSSENGILYNKNKTNLIQCPNGIGGDFIISNTVDSVENYAFAYNFHLLHYMCQELLNI
jgi:hypothetical protein